MSDQEKNSRVKGFVFDDCHENIIAYNIFEGCDDAIDMKKSTGNHIHSNFVTSKEEAILNNLKEFIEISSLRLKDLEIIKKDYEEIKANVEAINIQISSSTPNSKKIIAPCLNSIKRILESASSSAIGGTIGISAINEIKNGIENFLQIISNL